MGQLLHTVPILIVAILSVVLLSIPFHPLTVLAPSQGDFTIALNPSVLSLNSTSGGDVTIELASTGGLLDFVNLSTSVAPRNDLNAYPSASGVTLPPTGPMPTLHVAPGPDADGNYTVTVTGNYGSIVHSASIQVSVRLGPNISLTANPSSLSLTKGSFATAIITAASKAGFQGTVTLELFPSGPGLPDDPTGKLSSTVLNVPLGGSGSTTLNVSSTENTLPALYELVVYASLRVPHWLSVQAIVTIPSGNPDFVIWTSLPTLRMAPNSTGYPQIGVRSLNSFTGTVLVTDISQPSTLFQINSTTVTVPVMGRVVSVALTVVASTSTSPGNYTVNLAAKSSTLVRYASFKIQVTNRATVNLALSSVYVKAQQGGSASFMVTADSFNGFADDISIQTPSVPTNGPTIQPVQSYDISSPVGKTAVFWVKVENTTMVGTYPAVVSALLLGTGGFHQLTAVIMVEVVPLGSIQDFFLLVLPDNSAVIPQGLSANFTVNIVGSGFDYRNVTLYTSRGFNISFLPSQRPLDYVARTLNVMVSSIVPVGRYYVWILATSPSGQSSAARLEIGVSPFEVKVDPDTVSTVPSTDVTTTVTINGLNGFNGTVSLYPKSDDEYTGQYVVGEAHPTSVTLSKEHPAATAVFIIHVRPFPSPPPTYSPILVGGEINLPSGLPLYYGKPVRVHVDQEFNNSILCSFCNLPAWQTWTIFTALILGSAGLVGFIAYRRRKQRNHWAEYEKYSPPESGLME